MTQFGRALAELNIEILCANSSQDKGRVERANLTLQDRLVKELRAAEVSDMDAGNLFLPAFMEQFNERFSVPPAKTEDLHRRLSMSGSRFKDMLFRREQRYVGADATGPQASTEGDDNSEKVAITRVRDESMDPTSSQKLRPTPRWK